MGDTYLRSASRLGSFFYAPMYYFWRGIVATVLFQSFILIAIQAFLYVISDKTPTKIAFFLNFGLSGFIMFALNVALIYTFTFIIFRGFFSPLIFMITTMLYSAAVKYFTGSLFFGIALNDQWMILFIGGYTYIMTYLDSLLRDELQSAITYRTTSDD